MASFTTPSDVASLQEQLQRGIDTNDINLVKKVLWEGANPHDSILFKASDEVFDLVKTSRRLGELYPEPPRRQESKLDKALREMVVDDSQKIKAIQLLKKEMQASHSGQEKSVSEVWAGAVRSKKMSCYALFFC